MEKIAPKLLLIEDDKKVSAGLQGVLERKGITVLRQSSALPVIQEKLWSDASAIICDVSLPDMDGVEAVLRLRREGCQLPILFITGLWGLDLAPFERSLQPFRIIYKPFGMSGFMDALGGMM